MEINTYEILIDESCGVDSICFTDNPICNFVAFSRKKLRIPRKIKKMVKRKASKIMKGKLIIQGSLITKKNCVITPKLEWVENKKLWK